MKKLELKDLGISYLNHTEMRDQNGGGFAPRMGIAVALFLSDFWDGFKEGFNSGVAAGAHNR